MQKETLGDVWNSAVLRIEEGLVALGKNMVNPWIHLD